jgi:circadian clock protein KaiC
MLDGGYVRGASVLVTGAPGTAKSTLCGAFIEAACKRGERCLCVGLDEVSGEVMRNLTSVGIDLAPHIESGLLRMYSVRIEARSAEEHLLRIKALLNEHAPTCVAIDPISALVKAGGPLSALAVAQRLLYLAKAKGITLMLTSLTGGADALTESANIEVSTVADVWLHLSYVVKGGERNRALTIIKARGTRHSNQVRELVLSDTGITLADVYTAGGEVLMGTLRWERENAERRERARLRVEAERKRRELDLALQDTRARIEALQRQLEVQQAEFALLREEQEVREASWERQEQHVRRMRRGDASPPTGPEDGAPPE